MFLRFISGLLLVELEATAALEEVKAASRLRGLQRWKDAREDGARGEVTSRNLIRKEVK